MPPLRDPLRGALRCGLSAVAELSPIATISTPMDQVLYEYLKYLDKQRSRRIAHQSRSGAPGEGDVKTAEADLLLALQRNLPGCRGCELGDLYRATNRDVMAGGLLQQALALSPQSSQVRVAMALWHVRQGNLAKGIDTLAEGYAKSLDAGSAYIYAVALNSADQPEQAMTVVDDLLNADLHNLQVLELGISLARQNRSMERLGRYQVALRAL